MLNPVREAVVAERVECARTFWPRLVGLIGRRSLPAGAGMFFDRCGAIHTFGLRFPIDVLFLDQHHRVLHVIHALPPCRVGGPVRGAASVLELPAGTLSRVRVELGDCLQLVPSPPPTHLR